MDAVLQALGDGSRRTMLEILRDHPATVTELAEALPIARPGVSRHLRVLREAGLVSVQQDAQRRIYSLRPEALREVDEWLESYRALWQVDRRRLPRARPGPRPGPVTLAGSDPGVREAAGAVTGRQARLTPRRGKVC